MNLSSYSKLSVPLPKTDSNEPFANPSLYLEQIQMSLFDKCSEIKTFSDSGDYIAASGEKVKGGPKNETQESFERGYFLTMDRNI